MRYSDEIIEEVRSRNDIVDVVGQYVHLQKKGANYFGLCPFHNEKSGSFSVSGHKQMYYCFGCGAGGNVITFLMKYDNLTFTEAVKQLADRAGIKLPDEDDSPAAKAMRDKRQILLDINKEAAKYYYYQLRGRNGQKGMEYFRGRKLTDETMQHFGLGYSNITSDDLVKHLKSLGYEDSQIIDAGLASYDEKYGTHDKFWNRVMFPIQDASQKVIGFGGRVLGDGKPKYLNSPETLIFDKSRNLFGLNYAKNSRAGYMIICEGYMDVIAMHQAGFTMAVASLGTAFTTGQAMILKRYTDEVILSYDSDEAGTKAALRGIGILKEAGLKGKVLDLRPHKDPDEFIKNEGKEAFEERIRNAESTFFFEVRVMESHRNLADPEDKTEFYRDIARKLCEFEEPLERENYTEAVAARYNIAIADLKGLVASYAGRAGMVTPARRPESGIQSKKKPEDGARKNQRLLLTWLTDEPDIYPKVAAWVTPDDFSDDLYRKVATEVFTGMANGNFSPAAILDHFTEEEQYGQVAEMFNTNLVDIETKDQRRKAFRDIILGVKQAGYDRQKKELKPDDPDYLNKTIQGKKALEKLAHANISPDD
ncbi:DNA primase DnaG [Butyrivibrio proteoclasticus B316]|uniref:DNA primase n=1 Tax=Butyrivibrio proteoclasticus (strain ATCC 51982 / DSM 14932 / B316) TaxID=515622 RepID=E0S1I7_BUTPB|nr:DNA primase [Butyrivibrio proteoclasticus]ADL33662.1 DNA primase DnaG [Butyrivibrio proteoclasticus B316]